MFNVIVESVKVVGILVLGSIFVLLVLSSCSKLHLEECNLEDAECRRSRNEKIDR